jgi:hypothetical protein
MSTLLVRAGRFAANAAAVGAEGRPQTRWLKPRDGYDVDGPILVAVLNPEAGVQCAAAVDAMK